MIDAELSCTRGIKVKIQPSRGPFPTGMKIAFSLMRNLLVRASNLMGAKALRRAKNLNIL